MVAISGMNAREGTISSLSLNCGSLLVRTARSRRRCLRPTHIAGGTHLRVGPSRGLHVSDLSADVSRALWCALTWIDPEVTPTVWAQVRLTAVSGAARLLSVLGARYILRGNYLARSVLDSSNPAINPLNPHSPPSSDFLSLYTHSLFPVRYDVRPPGPFPRS